MAWLSRSRKTDDTNVTDEPDVTAAKSFPCPDCLIVLPTVGKLNWHRQCVHEKPHRCFAPGCDERFAQKQALRRHTAAKHRDTNPLTTIYHCTVDGCKYSSTGSRRKPFARLDHLKEHIKDVGHYGPHSACERSRRPGSPLFTEQIITARFEVWRLDENSETHQRTVETCRFHSCKDKTKLWHLDVTDDRLLYEDGDTAAISEGLECSVDGCYFASRPPEGCEIVLFKTERALQEHCRRVHGALSLGFSLATQQLLEAEQHSSVPSSGSTENTIYSSRGSELDDTDMQDAAMGPLWPSLGMFGYSPSFHHQLDSELGYFRHETVRSTPSNDLECFSGTYVVGTSQPDLLGLSTPRNKPDITFHSYLAELEGSLFSIPGTAAPISINDHMWLPSDNIGNEFAIGSSALDSNPTLVRQDSERSRKGRTSCSFPDCTKNFQRKADLQRHMNEVHSSKSYNCYLCDGQFRRKDRFTCHLQTKHGYPSRTRENGFHVSDYIVFPGSSRPPPPSDFVSVRDVVPPSDLRIPPSLHFGQHGVLQQQLQTVVQEVPSTQQTR